MTSNYQSLEQIAKESPLVRPFRILLNRLNPHRIVLDKEQYSHVLDRRSGIVSLVEGPIRKVLGYDEQIIGDIESKIVVQEHHFCIVKNPVDQKGQIQYGAREVRVGPKRFALHPGEELDGNIAHEYVLTKYEALLVKAIVDFNSHHAGEKFLVKGPITYIPSKNEQVIREIKAITLSDTDGIYVQNQDTGDVRLVKGPIDYFLEPNEQLYQKEITNDELEAVGLEPQRGGRGVRILTRQAANTSFLEDRTKALVLELEEKEVVFLYDGSNTRIEQGPKTVFLEPYERPRVLHLSGGKPIQQNALKIALVKLGPDFIYDQIKVRTKDNAQITVNITYKWRFGCAEDVKKAFSIDDFVGYAAETLSSEVRAVVAKHDFEELHANALEYVKQAIFGDKHSRFFEENGLEIFGVDLTGITPEDPKIAEKLHEAIKQNMDIYCKKLVLKATLESERQEVEGRKNIEAERKDLINARIANQRLETTEAAKISAEAEKIRSESEAEAIKITGKANIESEKQRLSAIINELKQDGGDKYLDLQRVQTFKDAEKLVVVPSDSKIVLPFVRTGLGEE